MQELKNSREQKNITKTEFAKMVRVSKTYITSIENGNRLPNRKVVDGYSFICGSDKNKVHEEIKRKLFEKWLHKG